MKTINILATVLAVAGTAILISLYTTGRFDYIFQTAPANIGEVAAYYREDLAEMVKWLTFFSVAGIVSGAVMFGRGK